MFQVHIIHAGNRHLYEDTIEQHFRIRHDICVGEMRWMELERPDGRDVDQFDTDKAVYLLGLEPERGVVAGSRLLPTLEPHLLGNVFPELANIRGVPHAPDIFEWTRFFVHPARRESNRPSKAAGIIQCAIVEFCLSQNIRKISGVCEAHWLPRLQALGWNPCLLGEPMRKDSMTIVGLSTDMTTEALERTRSAYGIIGSVIAPVSIPFNR
ncbi:acyl-homoserine-lactone synthase [Archangium gephyra]|nr:acyl-homoserine-lactone synthase [Archangium gephyra]